MKKKLILFLPLTFVLSACEIDINASSYTSKLIPNWVSFVTQLGALLVLILVVIVFAYKPIKKILKQRQDYIENNIKEAEENKAKWQENQLKSETTVLESNRTAANIVAEAKLDAEKERNIILDQTAKDVEKMKRDAENDIARMEKEAEEQIKEEMVTIALAAAEELLGREVDSSDNTRLVEEFIDQVKKDEEAE